MPTQFELGFLAGLLVGEGHFGGDGRQPQVVLRMHVRHEAIFQWLERTFPGGASMAPITMTGGTTSSGWHAAATCGMSSHRCSIRFSRLAWTVIASSGTSS